MSDKDPLICRAWLNCAPLWLLALLITHGLLFFIHSPPTVSPFQLLFSSIRLFWWYPSHPSSSTMDFLKCVYFSSVILVLHIQTQVSMYNFISYFILQCLSPSIFSVTKCIHTHVKSNSKSPDKTSK